MGRQYKNNIFFVIFCTIVSLLLTELSLQIIHYNADHKIVRNTFLKQLAQATEPPFSWERFFLANYITGGDGDTLNFTKTGLHQPHTTRGWALKPNITETIHGKTFTTNNHGYRSLYEFNFDPGKYGVIIVGDSFTFGDGIDDRVTWPHLLKQLDNKLNIFNLAGSGYGVDQMYITLSETISQYRPKLIIAAFIDNDLHRSLLNFRDYKKPRFILNNDELIKTNTPIGNFEEVINEISQKTSNEYSRVQIINVFNRILRKLKITDYIREPRRSETSGGCGYDCTRINEKLFENMAEMARENNADFLLLYLPYGEEIINNEFKGYGEFFFSNYKTRHKHFFLNPRGELVNATFKKSGGHYRESENSLLSKIVYEKIQKLPSWKNFKMK